MDYSFLQLLLTAAEDPEVSLGEFATTSTSRPEVLSIARTPCFLCRLCHRWGPSLLAEDSNVVSWVGFELLVSARDL